MLHMDFETYNDKPISAGASKYSLTAEVLCLAYSVDDGATINVWLPGQPMPADLRAAIESDQPIVAHNYQFEKAIWQNVMVARYGWPPIDYKRWRCTMAEALALGLPASLEKLAIALEVGAEKDMEGRRLMLKLAKPRKPTKNNPATRHSDKADLERLVAYCKQDVRTEIAVHEKLHRLNPSEQKVCSYDGLVNDRGIQIDREMVTSCIAIWEQYAESLTEELCQITFGEVTSANQVAEILDYLRCLGVEIESLSKQNVEAALSKGEFKFQTAKRILEIRQALSLSSIAKFGKMLECAEPDNRIRGCLQYHGAQTGRFAGRLIQPQNFARGELDFETIESLIEVAKQGDLNTFRSKSPIPVGNALSSMLRSAITAGDGHKLVVCDFASVEARGLAWAAQERWLLEAFTTGQDIYKHMAGDIYSVEPTEVTKAQRQVGKMCVAADTLVVTNNGPKRIVDVCLQDLVWDGIEWVAHNGLIYQGDKPVIKKHGVSATQDHKVWTTSGWMEWGECSANDAYFQSALDVASLPSRDTNTSEQKKGTCTGLSAIAEKGDLRGTRSWSVGSEYIVNRALQGNLQNVEDCDRQGENREARRNHQNTLLGHDLVSSKSSGTSDTYAVRVKVATNLSANAIVGGAGSCCPLTCRGARQHSAITAQEGTRIKNGTIATKKQCRANSTGQDSLTDSVPRIRGAETSKTNSTLTTVVGESLSTMPGCETERPSCGTSKLYQDGTIQNSKWTESTMKEGMNPATSGLSPEASIWETAGVSGLSRSESKTSNEESTSLKRSLPVYDLTNCGPRHRFTILTSEGPVIISNCLLGCGYGMGGRKFRATLANAGIEVDEEFAERIVRTYRTKNAKIRNFWYSLENAAKDAIKSKHIQRVGPFAFHIDGDFLMLRMPCGRDIAYFKPEIVAGDFGPQIAYMGVSPVSGKLERTTTYGGKLTENAIQALCRDLMISAMNRLEKKGYQVVISIHDEVVCEVPKDFGSVTEMEQIMTEVPDWAKGFPVGAEGWEGVRYRK